MNADDRPIATRFDCRTQRRIRFASGILLMFFAVGFGSWFSGAASWVGFYAGARGQTLATLAQVTTAGGFLLGVVMPLAWYGRRCRRGDVDVPPLAALSACLVLPLGNIFWAIFTDAIAWHYRQDIVRPAFDYAMMYLVLGGVLPMMFAVPWVVFGLRRRASSPPLSCGA